MQDTNTRLGVIAAFLGALTILIGAFGAHGLKNIVDEQAVASFETGVRYQMYHVFVLLISAYILPLTAKQRIRVARIFGIGILLFSGSIYMLVLRDYLPFDSYKIAFITPIGGVFFIIGWIALAFYLLKSKKENSTQ
ncbi:MAG TPA: DUF423 domain-containing protein [Flavobacteriaceae bacterium]|nr:DUF423 domain-containing protein [Flavobacteriaceae bacterium]